MAHPFDHRHPAAESREALRHLASDRPRTDDGQARRQFGQRKDAFIGEVSGLCKSWNGRLSRSRARADHRLLEGERLAGDSDDVRSREAAVTKEDIHAQAFIAMDGIGLTDPCPQLPHPLHGYTEVVLGSVWNAQSIFLGVAQFGPDARGADDGFGRHASDIQAVATHEMLFDQRDLGADGRSDHGGHQTGRAGSHHD